MGRENVPAYIVSHRPDTIKPSFDERCEIVKEGSEGWFSSMVATKFHSEKGCSSICKSSDIKRQKIDRRPPLRVPLVDNICNAFPCFVSSGIALFLHHCVLAIKELDQLRLTIPPDVSINRLNAPIICEGGTYPEASLLGVVDREDFFRDLIPDNELSLIHI